MHHWKLLLPLIVVLCGSWIVLLLEPCQIEVRTGLPATALLTTVFLQQSYVDQLPQVADELRQYIVDVISEIGNSHFGASLGVVELSVALHYVFDTPKDQLVWDVGHQAYGHKILTGRRDRFHTNRLKGGISGFPKRSESEYDTFGVGHSSTSISAALGMAVANSLAGVKIGGARQIECTINGLGERAGNTALEEIVMALRTRKDYFDLICNIDATQIVPASKMVSHITGFVVQPNKAVVGANAFAHTSGIHQDGILKNRETYEIMRAEDVGWTANKIVLGKLSGRNAFKQRLHDLGIVVEAEADVNEAFTRFKALADQKAEIFDEDIIAIMSDTASAEEGEHYKFISMSQHSETGERPKSRITLRIGDKEVSTEAEGNGPVDASLNAIEEVAKSGAEQLLYSVNAITSGTQSQGEVTVRLAKGGRIVNGVGTDPDIIAASAKAYLAALNKLHDPSQAKMNAQMTP